LHELPIRNDRRVRGRWERSAPYKAEMWTAATL
jgi:hypothetical protein